MSNGADVWIVKRKNKYGYSHVVRWIDPVTGRNPGKTFQRATDAREWASQLRKDIACGDYFSPVKISYDDWVKFHLGNMRNSPDIDVSHKTIEGHREGLEALKKECNPVSPHVIDPKMIRDFRKKQLKNGLEPRTINKRIEVIRSALSYAVRADILQKNKLFGPHRLFLPTTIKEPRILTIDEVRKLVNATDDIRIKATLLLAFYHGLRRGEICWLKWADIDFDNHLVKVVDRKGVHRTKTKRSRTVVLRAEAEALLSQIHMTADYDWVFDDPKFFYNYIDRERKKMLKRCGIPNCGLHDLRKTCNTMILDADNSRETATQILGHRNDQVNIDHYTGTMIERQRNAINSLPSIMESES